VIGTITACVVVVGSIEVGSTEGCVVGATSVDVVGATVVVGASVVVEGLTDEELDELDDEELELELDELELELELELDELELELELVFTVVVGRRVLVVELGWLPWSPWFPSSWPSHPWSESSSLHWPHVAECSASWPLPSVQWSHWLVTAAGVTVAPALWLPIRPSAAKLPSVIAAPASRSQRPVRAPFFMFTVLWTRGRSRRRHCPWSWAGR
jgi:hypothetical protein